MRALTLKSTKTGLCKSLAALFAGAGLLIACTSQQVGERRIELTGAGVKTGPIAAKIGKLLQATNRTYVTLGVFDRSTRETQEGDTPEEIATSGSGFVIDRGRGLILTAAHVAITRGWVIKARGPDGSLFRGRVLKTVPNNDIALVRFESTRGLTQVTPAASSCLRPGQPVFSLGKPSHKGDTARIGTVASLSYGNSVSYMGFGYPDAMVVRLHTEKGESGGPLFDENGRLVGMVVSTVTDNNGRSVGLAHALPLPALARVVCSTGRCTPAWRAHVGRSLKSCPAT